MTRLFVIAASVLALIVGLTVVPRVARAEVQAATETPTIELQPSCWVTSGLQALTIAGHSFEPNVKVNVFDATGGQAFTTATTDEYGTFTAHLNIPIMTSGNEIKVADASGEKDLATAVFRSCDYGAGQVKILPACSSDASPTLHMVGTGWATISDAPIDFRLDFGGDTGLAEMSIDPAASFDFVWTPVSKDPNKPIPWDSGVYGVLVTQNSPSDQTVENYAQPIFRVPCPKVTVTPQCAPAGAPPTRTTLTISGSGFDPTNELRILFDDAGKPQEFSYTFPAQPTPDPYATGASPPPADGSFGPITINPFSRPAETYTLELFQLNRSGIDYDYITTVRFPCYQPSLAPASPECGDAVGSDNSLQYSITLEGSDFVPNAGITIVFDPDDAAGSDYQPVAFSGKTDANGALYAAISPSYRPPNIYRILAYQDTDAGHFEANTTFTVPCIGPPISPPPTLPPGSATIAVSPTCAPAADGQSAAYSLGLTGGGFAPGPVTVVLDPAGKPFTGTVDADISGYVSATFVADGKANGTYQLVASQDNNGTHIEASTTLTVPCQTVTIDPTCEPAADGQAGAYAITANGLGFDPGVVDLVFDPTGLSPAATQVQADVTGAFSAPLTLTGKPAGVYDLVASQESSYGLFAQASAQLVVPCGAVRLRITPDSGPRGLVPMVEGFGFPPNATVVLKWDVGIGASQPVTVQADAQGYFSRQLLIFQHDFLGIRHVSVAAPDNAAAYPGVTATYLVAAAPIQPPFSADDENVPSPDPVILQR